MKKLRSNFACRCSEGAREECDRVKAWAKEYLDCNENSLLTCIVHALTLDYEAGITSIASDQWCGIAAETYDKDFNTWIQCDYIEDGFTYTLRKFYDQFGDKRESRSPT